MGSIEKPDIEIVRKSSGSGRPKGYPKTGGRQKGSVNKVLTDIKPLAKEYGPRAIAVLAQLMENCETPAPARISAARELLLRGYGAPSMSLDVDIKTSIYKLTDAELLDIAARGRSLPQQDCIDITPAQVSLPGLDDDTDDG